MRLRGEHPPTPSATERPEDKVTRGYPDSTRRSSQSERREGPQGVGAGPEGACSQSLRGCKSFLDLGDPGSLRFGNWVAIPPADGAAFKAALYPTGSLLWSWVLPVTRVTLNKCISCCPSDPSGKWVVSQANKIKLERCKSKLFLNY